ncbi:MAG: GDSL family lipase [Eubacterium sp.]|nr:GDSL family lipase [Eubacterium sp.]
MKPIKFIAAVCSASLLFLGACSNDIQQEQSGSEPIQEEESGMKTYIPNSTNVKPLGRTYEFEDSLWLTFSGSGAEFTFNGTKASVTIEGDSNAETANEENQARVAIYLNGERVIDEMINQATQTFDVFESETPEDCTIKIIKLSETAMSTVGISEIAVESAEGIKPTEAKELSIEFIGDSITCGYGVDDEDANHHFSTATEDVTKAYAYKTAQKLDADYSMVSISGYGIISGYSDGTKKVSSQVVPKYYTKLGFSYRNYKEQNPAGVVWDFSRYTPDLIVVNLGTNDDSYTLNDAERQQEYCDEYVEFLKKIREHNPDAKILCTLGIMGDRLFPMVEKAASTYSEETGDTNISTLKFDPQNGNVDGYAADWHPTEATHEKASDKLVEEIKNILG